MSNLVDLVARLLISALFLISAYNKILSVDGKVLKSEFLTSSKIDVSFLKKGIYFLEYRNRKIKLIKH